MGWKARPNEPLRTNCPHCGAFELPGHLCAKKHDAQIRRREEIEAASEADADEARFRRVREAAEKAREAHRRADASGRLNRELARLAGLSPREFVEHQSALDRQIREREG